MSLLQFPLPSLCLLFFIKILQKLVARRFMASDAIVVRVLWLWARWMLQLVYLLSILQPIIFLAFVFTWERLGFMKCFKAAKNDVLCW